MSKTKRPTNQDLIDGFLDYYKHSPQSVKTRKSCLKFFFNTYSGHVFDITPQTLKSYFTELKNMDTLTISTRKTKWNILISFLKFTMEDYPQFIVIIPAKRISWVNAESKKEKTRSNKDVYMTIEEIQKLLSYFKVRNYKHYLIFRVFTETGMRKGELIHAEISDLNLEDRYFHIRKGKTGKKYYIITEDLRDQLKLYLNERLKQQQKNGNGREYLFLTKSYTRFGDDSFNIILKYCKKILGYEKNVSSHTFRRTLNDLRKEMGSPLEDRKILLGHSVRDVNIESYTRNDITRLKELYDRWNPYKDLPL